MQELINKLQAEAGLTAEQASKALNVMVGHVKSILPPAFAGSIDNMLSTGKVDPTSTAGQIMAGAAAPKSEESLMDKAGDVAGQARDKIADLADAAKEKVGQFVDKEKISDMADKAGEKLEDLADKADELADKAEDMAKDAFGKLKGFFGGKKSED